MKIEYWKHAPGIYLYRNEMGAQFLRGMAPRLAELRNEARKMGARLVRVAAPGGTA